MPDLRHEHEFWDAGLRWVAGLDEAGRGPWAGPVTAAAVVLPAGDQCLRSLAGVDDSKRLTPRRREELLPAIQDTALAWGVGAADAGEIDRLGIVPATRLAMERALAALGLAPQALLIDALRLPGVAIPQLAIIHGDSLSLSIAAASVLAKVTRDRLMVAMDEQYPGYGFARHKGYGTRAHAESLALLGVCPLHRRSFAPVARRLTSP